MASNRNQKFDLFDPESGTNSKYNENYTFKS